MLISLNWIRDFVDLPQPDKVDPRELVERFTRTTAEVDGLTQVSLEAKGLIAAHIVKVTDIPDPDPDLNPNPGTRNLRLVTLDIGQDSKIQTVSAALVLHEGSNVVFAPPGSSLKGYENIGVAKVAGQESHGVILPGEAIGITMALQEAIFLPDDVKAGQALPPDLFDDWVIEVDNKSLTHRPDLWGHYGIAREIAAIEKLPLKPYPVVSVESLQDKSLPDIPINISDPNACRRYTGLFFKGVPTQPAPLWMQLRLGHVGLRPITGLVDLTNYIMLDLGQPMHAFDAAKVEQVEVDWAKEGETFRTLDGAERILTSHDLMIKCDGKSVALAGVMGGLDTEVTESTTTLLLESANFDPATVRRTAIRLGLRTDASARFEKSLDPAHTALAIQRFIELARPMYPHMRITSRLSDGYPQPAKSVSVSVNLKHVRRTMGRDLAAKEIVSILKPLGFGVEQNDDHLSVQVPSYRATGDVALEADVIEEIARYVGYNNVEPAMPRISVRKFEPNALHELEQRSLEYFAIARGYHEIHGYLWYDSQWLEQLGVDPGPCVELQNPAAHGLHRLRQTLLPGMLAAVVKNRFHFSTLALTELGSVFEKDSPTDREDRHLAMVRARRGKHLENDLCDQLKGDLESWAWQRFASRLTFEPTQARGDRPWEHPQRTALIRLGNSDAGLISVVDLSLRRSMDEHLSAWSIAWAELTLSGLESLPSAIERHVPIPEHPLVEMDFSIVVDAQTQYGEVAAALGDFTHPLLTQIRYVGSFEGKSIGAGKRSLTFKTAIGHRDRTLVDQDATDFRSSFEEHLKKCNYDIRR